MFTQIEKDTSLQIEQNTSTPISLKIVFSLDIEVSCASMELNGSEFFSLLFLFWWKNFVHVVNGRLRSPFGLSSEVFIIVIFYLVTFFSQL